MNKDLQQAMIIIDDLVVPFAKFPRSFYASLVFDARLIAHTTYAAMRYKKTCPTASPAIIAMLARTRAWWKVQPEAMEMLQLDLTLTLSPDMY